jgi:hypothetical protein
VEHDNNEKNFEILINSKGKTNENTERKGMSDIAGVIGSKMYLCRITPNSKMATPRIWAKAEWSKSSGY